MHLFDKNGKCVYCLEDSGVELTLSNYEKYLSISSSCNPSMKRAIITISSTGNYKFKNVTVSVQVYFKDKLGGQSTETEDIKIDNDGNGSDLVFYDAEVKYKGENPAIASYSVTILAITGTVTE